MIDTVDQTIDSLIKSIELKKKALAPLEQSTTTPWKTKGVLAPDVNFGQANLLTMKLEDVQALTTKFLMLQDYHQRSNQFLGLSTELVIQNYSVQDWLEDCKKRATVLCFKQEMQKLNCLESKLRENMSSDKKRMLAIEEVQAQLG